jgi:glycine dehydrogenase subunit 1
LREELCQIKGVRRRFAAPHFNEFVVELPESPAKILPLLREKKILGGIDIENWGKGLEKCLLVCATEMNSKEQIEEYVQALKEIL